MIISESGRAIAAHHSVLVFDVLGRSALDGFDISTGGSASLATATCRNR